MGTYTRKTPLKEDCPMEKTLNIISGKWKIAVLCELNRGDCRLTDLEKYNPEASKRSLTKILKELVDDGIIKKTDFNVYPKKVVYSLTSRGIDLISVLKSLDEFGKKV